MQDVHLNLRHLRAFCAVVDTRSVSAAARQVHLSQPAITQAIAKLEKEFGLTLFERSSLGMEPSRAAIGLADRAGRAFAMINAGIAEAQRVSGERNSRLGPDALPLLTSTQLRAFVAVGTAGNFSLAARQFGSSQPALHRSARELETLLQIDLFEKTTRGIALTRAGHHLFQQLKLAFAELAQARMELDAQQGIGGGTIAIGSLPLSRHVVIPAAISRFAAGHPSVNVKMIDAPYPELLHALRYGEIDVMMGALRHPAPVEDVVQEPLFESSLCIAARRDHPLAKKRKLTARDLHAYPWVVPVQATPTRAHFEAMFTRAGLPVPEGLVETGSVVLMRSLLTGSDRLALIASQQVRVEAETGLLAILPFDLGDTRRDIGLTLRKGFRPTVAQAAFLDCLREAGRRYGE
jgi:DNA-binding transcriptional LysR family regulator